MFKNRKEAGEKLAATLLAYKNANTLVLAIPRGGVEVGYYITQRLGCEFSIVISRKLGFPLHPETAFGAITEDMSYYINPLYSNLLTEKTIMQVREKETREIKRRIRLYRKGTPLTNIKGKTIILTDDGIATGATFFAATELCKKNGAEKIIAALPVSGITVKKMLLRRVDEAIILETPEDFFAVSQSYLDFPDLTDDQVIRFTDKLMV